MDDGPCKEPKDTSGEGRKRVMLLLDDVTRKVYQKAVGCNSSLLFSNFFLFSLVEMVPVYFETGEDTALNAPWAGMKFLGEGGKLGLLLENIPFRCIFSSCTGLEIPGP